MEGGVSIVIPAYNAEATLAECLAACLKQTRPATEVIVVDDGSTDATARIAQSFPIHYIRQDQRGPAAARNRGANAAQGTILAFTDADCVPAPDWIERLAGWFDDRTVAVGGTYAIANPESVLARMVHAEIVMRHARYSEHVDFLGSFNMACRRDAFEAAGGFDETFRAASAEDNDLAYRLMDAGGALRFAPGAVVAHYHPSRLWPYLRTQMRHGYWRVKLYAKHPRRAGTGDQYASLIDFLMPPVALLLLASLPFLLVQFRLRYLMPYLIYFCMRLGPSLRSVRPYGARWILLFTGMTALRDVARGIGLVAGIGRFLVMEKALKCHPKSS